MVSIDRLVLAGALSAARSSATAPQQPGDSKQGELAWPFASGPVGMHSSPPLIGRYRSIRSSNRPDSISLGFLTVLPLRCMSCVGLLAMSTIEFAEELNQPRHRFSNTGAMNAEAAALAFVRRVRLRRPAAFQQIVSSRRRHEPRALASHIYRSPNLAAKEMFPWRLADVPLRPRLSQEPPLR